MKRLIVLALGAILVLSCAANGYSQVKFYLGAYAGYSAQTPSFDDVEFDTNTTFLYGLRGGIRLWFLAVEAGYFGAAHNIEVQDFPSVNWDGAINDYSYIGLNVKLFFSILFLHPYLTAGYGYYTADIHNIDKDQEGGYNGGVGLEIKLGKKFSILAEGKYHHVTVNIDHFDIGLGNWTLTAGFNYYF